MPDEGEREERNAKLTEQQQKVMALVREKGEVRPADVAELLGVRVETAAGTLKRMCRTGGPLARRELVPGSPRKGVAYRDKAEGIAPADDDGLQTDVERRIVAAVREKGPIDETTLAANAGIRPSSLRTVLGGLLSRKLVVRREEEGVSLFEVAA